MACASSVGKPYHPHGKPATATAARVSVRSARMPSTGGKKGRATLDTSSSSSSDSESDSDSETPAASSTALVVYDEKTRSVPKKRMTPEDQQRLARREIEAALAANGSEPWSKRLTQKVNAFTPFPHLTFNDTAEDYSFSLTFSVAGKWSHIVSKYSDRADSSDGCLRLHIPFNNEADMGLQKGVFVPRRVALTSSYVHDAPFGLFARLRAKTHRGNNQTWMDGINRLSGNPAGPPNVGLLVATGFSDRERCLFDWDHEHVSSDAFQHWATIDIGNTVYDIKTCEDDAGLAAFSHVPTAHVLRDPLHYLAARHCGDLYGDAKELSMLSRVRPIVSRASGSEFRVPVQALRDHVTKLAARVDRDAHVMSPNAAFLELLVPHYDERAKELSSALTGSAPLKQDPYVECTFQFRIDGQVATHTELSGVVDELLSADGEEDDGDADNDEAA